MPHTQSACAALLTRRDMVLSTAAALTIQLLRPKACVHHLYKPAMYGMQHPQQHPAVVASPVGISPMHAAVVSSIWDVAPDAGCSGCRWRQPIQESAIHQQRTGAGAVPPEDVEPGVCGAADAQRI